MIEVAAALRDELKDAVAPIAAELRALKRDLEATRTAIGEPAAASAKATKASKAAKTAKPAGAPTSTKATSVAKATKAS
jgi:hypothetical protein